MTQKRLITLSLVTLLSLYAIYAVLWMVEGLDEIDEKYEFGMPSVVNISDINNETIKRFEFLACMSSETDYPEPLLSKSETILIELCYRIENYQPANLDELYELTHGSTIEFNRMEAVFNYHDTEIDSTARYCLTENFFFIANTYGFQADMEELIAPRTW